MEYLKIKLPNNEEKEFEYGKPVVILGANGAGKTRFSIKIEELNDSRFNSYDENKGVLIHRISAQKSLNILDAIDIRDYESSGRDLFIGDINIYATKNNNRYDNNPASILLNDYNKALSLLFSEANLELQKSNIEDKLAIAENRQRPLPIETVVDKATEIWNDLLPHRKLDLTGNGVHAFYKECRYHGKEMSDGERVILYMICQVMVQRPGTLLIIDEPELHIHKSIVDKLWSRLEQVRNDCVFMYITHDLDFAASRKNSTTIWIKAFDGTNWDYEFLDSTEFEEIPETLLYEIIGTRRKILFVEGTKDSYDYKLYQELFRDSGYHIIPVGGCPEVMRLVRSKKIYEKLSSFDIYGLVDRDYRTENEIASLQQDGIYCLNVAEVENLFVVPEILDIMERVLACNAGTADQAKKIIFSLFEQNKEKQMKDAFSREMNHQLTLPLFDKNSFSVQDVKVAIDKRFSEEFIDGKLNEIKNKFDSVSTLEDILRIFNFKELPKIISSTYGLGDKGFAQRVLNVLCSTNLEKQNLIEALLKYIPIP